MLEEKLQSLENKVILLTKAVESLTAALSAQPVRLEDAPDNRADGTKAKEKVKSKPKENRQVERPEESSDKPVSRDELQDLCLKIVRIDRTMKDTIKTAISRFGDAATLKDVPEADLPALHQVLTLTLENLEAKQ